MREDFETNPGKPRKIGIIFALAFIVLIVLIGLYVLGASGKKSTPLIVPTPTTVPTLIPVVTEEITSPTPTQAANSTPSPTPAKTTSTERSSLEITVLNGSGVAGAAKGISSYLEELGYTIKTTGNAKTYDYKGLTINVSKEKSSYLAQLKKDLTQKSSSISAKVDASLTVDAEVIIGK